MGKVPKVITVNGKRYKSEVDLADDFKIDVGVLHKYKVSTDMSYAEIINKIYGFDFCRTRKHKKAAE